MRISDWSSDVCSSDLETGRRERGSALPEQHQHGAAAALRGRRGMERQHVGALAQHAVDQVLQRRDAAVRMQSLAVDDPDAAGARSEEHTSELQSLMRISYAVFCLKKKKNTEKT